MNRSVIDVGGQILVVSQFTLYGDCRKGRRPGFFRRGTSPSRPNELLPRLRLSCSAPASPVSTRQNFQGGHERRGLVNDGPVTFLLDSGKAF